MDKGLERASVSLVGSCAVPQTSGLDVEAGCRFVCCVPGAISYTVLYNCLDFPAGVVPVTTVTSEDDAQMEHYRGYFGDIWDSILKKVKPACPLAHCPPDPAAVEDRVLALSGFVSLP